ncbi:MAG: helix-turn-helix domain-containing protein, partial [Burkholderiales bacterium]|nr:helix-turn-helix domain-containing protein [Burkholderiales bacterium]
MVLYVLWNLQTSAGRAVVRLCETEFGISRRQWRLLALLAEQPDMQPSALALRSGLDRARTSRALSGLVQKKLVQRIPRPGNRREVTLRLTEQGSALQARLLPRVADINGRLLSVLSPAERAQLADMLARLLVTPPHRQGGQAQYIEQPVPILPSESRLPGVLQWAREHLSEPLSLDVLADIARMSRRTFTRRFREATGTTVVKWLAFERVARAQQLLETTDMPIERVAAEVGFGTALSLRQYFSDQVRTSPSS